MTTETSSPEPENTEQNKDDNRRRLALVLLFLLLSFICIVCSSQGALYFVDRDKILGHMRSALQADYGLGVPVVFPRVDLARIIPEIVGDNEALLGTPQILEAGIANVPPAIAQVTPSPVPPIPTLTPTATPTPTSIPPTSSPPDGTEPSSPPPVSTSTPESTSSPVSPTTPAPAPTTPAATTPAPTTPAPTTPAPAPTTPSPPPDDPTATSPPPPPSPTATSPPPANIPPIAVDDVANTSSGVTVVIPVLVNDSDSDGVLITSTLSIITPPLPGTVGIALGTGDVTYMPAAGFVGVDTFVYQICDDDGACDTATVTITVIGTAPVAVDDTDTTPEETPINISVLANDFDVDGDPLTVISNSSPATGTVSINPPPPTYTITYNPPQDFNGDIFFTYTISDGNFTDTAMVTVTITPVDDSPMAVDDTGATDQDVPTTINVAANDSDVDGNLDPTSVVTMTNPLSGTTTLGPGVGEITYTPNPGISGQDTFNYQICDTSIPPLCDTAVVTVTITDTVPIAPINLRAAPGDMQISLGWDHTPPDDLVGYRVYRSDGAGPFITTSVITKYFDISVTNGTTYAYTVTAVDAAGNESGPSNLASATPTSTIVLTTTNVTCSGITYTNCTDAGGSPDDLYATISGTGVIILDFGVGQGIIDGPGFDMVFYERYRATVPGINLDYTTIEISTDGGTWFTVFDWDGDNPSEITGTNITSYVEDADGEKEEESILETDLYPGGVGSHGITIDIGVLVPAGNTYRFVRITNPGSTPGPEKQTEIDAIERLN